MGISFGSGPCLASCGPLFLSYTAGSGKNIPKSLAAYLIFSSARIAVYVVLGALVYLSGKFFTEQVFAGITRYVFWAGGTFIISMGILIAMGRNLDTVACKFLYKNLLQKDRKSIFIFGLIVGLAPCPPLIALFSYVALISKSLTLSAVYALSFGLGTLLSPLALLAIFAGAIPGVMAKFKPAFSRALNLVCAAILIILGAQLIIKAL
ncbi:MAG: sulfite exporter TauE/SafE family protein [Candidatus Omnitrophota bacterium]